MKKKLLLFTFLVTFVAMSFTAAVLSWSVEDIAREAAEERLMETTQLLLMQTQGLSPEGLQKVALDWQERQAQYRITFIQKDGKVLGDSGTREQNLENHQDRPEVIQAWQEGQGNHQRISATTGIASLYTAAVSPDGTFLVRVALPLHELDAMQNAVIRQSLWGVAIGLVFALGILALFSKYLLAPLERLRRATLKMSEGDYSVRMGPEPDEIGLLARDFNTMAQSLESSIQWVSQQRLLLNTVLNHVVTGILAIDGNGKLLLANPVARDLFQLPVGPPASTLSSDLLRRDPQLWQLLSVTLERRENQEAQLNRARQYQVSTAVLPAGEKEAPGVVMAIHDLTRVRKLESLRSEFVANATHELRTPLTSIQGYIETLSTHEDLAPEVRREILTILEMESHRLSHLIDDMLTLSEIENRPQDINESLCDASAIAGEVLRLLQPQADQKDVALILKDHHPPLIWARKDWLERMLINLVDNAIKYNRPQGQVILTLEPAGEKRLKIQVQDTGIGIPEESMERIFERFYRVDSSRSQHKGSTGLGLAIVKHMVALYQGTIQVHSQEGIGSIFTIELPVDKT